MAKKEKKQKQKTQHNHEMTTWGRPTCPQALQWCLRLVRALKGSLHFMHIVTSLSRIQRGARLPSSALCKNRNSAHSGRCLEKSLDIKVARAQRLPTLPPLLSARSWTTRSSVGRSRWSPGKPGNKIKTLVMHHAEAAPDTGSSMRSVCVP